MSKSSIEEQVEDIAKKQLSEIKYYTKTEVINSEIEKALKIAPSKSGGSGKNFPDIKLFRNKRFTIYTRNDRSKRKKRRLYKT